MPDSGDRVSIDELRSSAKNALRKETTERIMGRTVKETYWNVKFFGACSIINMIVVIGMSIYIIHHREFRFAISGKNLVDDNNHIVITDDPFETSSSLIDMLVDEENKSDEDISFLVQLPNKDIVQQSFKIGKEVRFQSGIVRIFDCGGNYLEAVVDAQGATAVNATWRDAGACLQGCPMVDEPLKNQLINERRLLVSRHPNDRKLWGAFKKIFSGSKKATSPSPSPAPSTNWKATSTCPWICKQGWWWQSSAYGKPACCTETYNSASPYDKCQYATGCTCDASCSSCCA